MGNYLFTDPKGWILVHELHSRPHEIIGYSENMSIADALKLIQRIENKLRYELEGTDNIEPISDTAMAQHYPKKAGFIHGEFHAG